MLDTREFKQRHFWATHVNRSGLFAFLGIGFTNPHHPVDSNVSLKHIFTQRMLLFKHWLTIIYRYHTCFLVDNLGSHVPEGHQLRSHMAP